MTDTPRVPLQGNIALSTVIPGVETSVAALIAGGGNDINSKLLLHFDGDDGAAVFNDSSRFAHPVIAHNVTTSSANAKFGKTSVRFNGTASPGYLQLDGSADFAFGSGNFTIEFWLRLNVLGVIGIIYDPRPIGSGGGVPVIYYLTDNKIRYLTDGADRIIATNPLVAGQWYHIAVVRTGTNTTKLFIDGVQTGSTFVDNTVYINNANRPVIGMDGSDLINYTINAWIDELRVSNIARWTKNFTPPALAYYDDNATIITADADEPIIVIDDDRTNSVSAS